jgi:hypothetical protein
MNSAFLNCNIWSVHTIDQPFFKEQFYLFDRIYYYNSLESGIIDFNLECIQIPEFEIQDIHLLNGLDIEFINQSGIPLLYRNEHGWKIDLTFYEDFKL